jgi:hypothetical protein
MNYQDDYFKSIDKPKLNKTDIVMEWSTNLGYTYRGTLRDWTTSDYMLERVDTKEMVTIPRTCCRVVEIINL